MKNRYKKRHLICISCGKSVSKRMPKGRKYCSLECYRRSERPQRKTGVQATCGNCGNEIYIRKSEIKNINFCSTKCRDKKLNRKISFFCKVCGKEFRWSPSRLKQQNPTYCSIECRNKCSEWKQKAVIAGNLIQQSKKGLNRLEKAGNVLLDILNIDYQTQVLICNKFLVDVLIPDKRIIIQWDGDYWHGFNEIKTESQKKRMLLDKSQDAYLKKAGYQIIRFWEHEVYKEKEKVIENIRKTIQ